MTRVGLLVVLALCLCVGCGGGDEPGAVSEDELGEAWPFSVSEGVLHCEGSGGVGAVTFEANGTTYAVNGFAKDQDAGADIEPIWVADPAIPGAKKSMAPIIDRGLALCD
jgi:Protein of unknown function (DUF2511)